MLSAHDVARELRRRLPAAGDLKIYKLAYYCQGWHLAWTGRPMFEEAMEAWAMGPVVADLWHDEDKGRPRPQARQPDDQAVAVLDYVVTRYGGLSGHDLARMTHSEDPWRNATEIDDAFSVQNPEITHSAMRDWFQQDDEFRSHRQLTARLGKDCDGLTDPVLPDGLREATLRALAQPS